MKQKAVFTSSCICYIYIYIYRTAEHLISDLLSTDQLSIRLSGDNGQVVASAPASRDQSCLFHRRYIFRLHLGIFFPRGRATDEIVEGKSCWMARERETGSCWCPCCPSTTNPTDEGGEGRGGRGGCRSISLSPLWRLQRLGVSQPLLVWPWTEPPVYVCVCVRERLGLAGSWMCKGVLYRPNWKLCFSFMVKCN